MINIIYKNKNIQDVSIGDYVLSYNDREKKNEIKQVIKTFQPNIKKENQYEIELENGEKSNVSNIHKFFTYLEKNNYQTATWKEPEELSPEMFLVSNNIENNNHIDYQKISKISKIGIYDKIYYDICVEDNHNYYGYGTTTKSLILHHNSATVFFPIWHQDIMDLLVLKNNKGTEDNRVRKLDYGISISKLFYERFMKNQSISLFSPHDVPGLYENYGMESFDEMYAKAEANKKIPRKTINASELFLSLIRERVETGRIYIFNIDHANTHSSFNEQITQSNLCMEISLPTVPIQTVEDSNGLIATCILSAINLGKINDVADLEELCDLAARGLDELIDFQGYPLNAAEKYTKSYRSLGIGYTGMAHYLAKNKTKYWDDESLSLMNKTTEAFQYYLIKSSVQMAKEKGRCEAFNESKYSKGILPIDTYKKDVDVLVGSDLSMDWETLRKEIMDFGMRNVTLTAFMPAESSSLVGNSTNGVEPPRDFLSVKKSKKGTLKQIVPQYQTLKNHYSLLWDSPNNEGYIKLMAVIQKYTDQSISMNLSYDPSRWENGEVPVSVYAKDILTAYKFGSKSLYYHQTKDGKRDVSEEIPKQISQKIIQEDEACESCAI